jgi:hypothetical protein
MSHTSSTLRAAPALAAAALVAELCAGCGGSTGAAVPQFSSSRIVPLAALSGPNIFTNHDAPGPGGSSGPFTSATPSAVVVRFRGNVSKYISAADLSHPFNPFCAPSYSYGCPITVGYQPSTNTTASTYTGHPFDPNGNGLPSQGPTIHVGIAASGQQNYDTSVALMYGASQKPVPSYFVSVNPAKLVKQAQTWAYAQVYISASLKPGANPVLSLWKEIGYVPGGSDQPKFTFKNYGTQTLYVQSSGIILNQPVPTDPACRKLVPLCKEDYSILASLNFTGSPPPGFSGSQFVPLQYPPAKVLKPEKL